MTALAADLAAALDPARLFRAAFDLAPLTWQAAYLREERPVCLLKGRQVGASLAAAALAVHTAIYRPGTSSIIVSPTLKQSSEIAAKARGGLRRLGIRLDQDSASSLRLANGSRVLSLPGTAKSVRGWSADFLVLDEAAYIPSETWTAARALVATGGRLIVQSTPGDEAGDFWEMVQADRPDVARFTVPSDSVPTISAAFLEAERAAMSPDAFDAEYRCIFAKTGAALFTFDRIEALFPMTRAG